MYRLGLGLGTGNGFYSCTRCMSVTSSWHQRVIATQTYKLSWHALQHLLVNFNFSVICIKFWHTQAHPFSRTCTHNIHFYSATVIGVKELAADLDSEATNWNSLGLQLDVNVDNTDNNTNRAAVCFRKTLEEWRRSGTATPKAIIEALRSPTINHNALANQLDKPGSQFIVLIDHFVRFSGSKNALVWLPCTCTQVHMLAHRS